MAQEMKAMTLRLPADQAAELEQVAAIDDVPVSEAVRAAISDHIAKRRQDGAFREKLQARRLEAQRIFDRLSEEKHDSLPPSASTTS